MMLDQRSALSSYMTRLLSEGRVVFTGAQARDALSITKGALLDAADFVMPTRIRVGPILPTR